MEQTKFQSFIEACVNTAIGFLITFVMSTPIYWMCNVKISSGQIFWVTVIFTFISVGRGYLIRRYFNNNIGGKIIAWFRDYIIWKERNGL